MAAGRKISDEDEARRFVMAAERAGQGGGEWARAHGIDGRSLHVWNMALNRRRNSAPAARRPSKRSPKQALVEIVPRAPVVTTSAKYILEHNGVRVEFGDDVSADTLRRVLLVVRSC